MSADFCIGSVCFVPLDANTPKLFGFSEFLAGLALMVLAWTIADVRYRFRVRTAPLPLEGLTFAVVAAVGILTLLTDLWRAEQWLVPQGNILTPASWQTVLGGVFFLTFLTWAWFAFVRPSVYGKWNAKRYATTLYRVILKGASSELVVIADELSRSAKALVHYTSDEGAFREFRNGEADNGPHRSPTEVSRFANDILLLIADKRFCRAIVESSPGTALAVFREIGETKKYGVQVGTFANNIVNEALVNKDSFLFHEAEGYDSGLIGYHKPLSQAMFSNHRMAEAIGTLLDPRRMEEAKWDATQWEAYCRVVLMTFRDYVENGFGNQSPVLHRAMGNIERAAADLYKLDGIESGAWTDDAIARLRIVVAFIKNAVEVLEKKGVHDHLRLRGREGHGDVRSIYDNLASMIAEVIFSASAVRSPVRLCWYVQHNAVWGELFNFDSLGGPAGKVIKFKVRRLLYNEIVEMRRFPNFKGAKILSFCLNVMGLAVQDERHFRDSKALQRAMLSWTTKNYAWLWSFNSRVAEACLVDGMTYDAEHRRLVTSYPAEGLRREPHYDYLNLDPPFPGEEKSKE